MKELLSRICANLGVRAYPNEATVREAIVVPILRELGWDTTDPKEVRPEHPNPAGRVDYALMHKNGRPAAFIEVKAVGRSLDGDRQLFGYCFEDGVPLAVLTDGNSWNFYVPAGLGELNERRIHHLKLEDRSLDDAETIFIRYLSRNRVLDGSARRDALDDNSQSIDRKLAQARLPGAWQDLLSEENELLVGLLQDKVADLCGHKPSPDQTLNYLQGLRSQVSARANLNLADEPAHMGKPIAATDMAAARPKQPTVTYSLFGKSHTASSAAEALVDILRVIVARDPRLLPTLSDRVCSRSRRHIAQSPEQINPNRPDLAKGEEISPGWLVGLQIDNRTKQKIIEIACETYGLSAPKDVDVRLPNC